MDDRFPADLRKHLLETADERPAEGQLAAVIKGVASTRQHPPLVARLTWTPGRIGPVPWAVVRYGLLAAALALAAFVGAMLGAGASPAGGSVFEGTWTATDPADGSGMILVVGPGDEPAVYFEDSYASGDACVIAESKRFRADGNGTVDGHRLTAEWPDDGGCGRFTVPMVDFQYDYDPGGDTLTDGDGLTWARALDAGRAPASAPPSEALAPATDALASDASAPATDVPATAPVPDPTAAP